ncbi:MAG: DUF5337 domain-containing protein [Rhodobacter sp.]|nr:DUF5337 domain-containing protein [Rhodobacter sp.]MCY4167278.1 DUF5337 domain-containing protein [Rhodobacter sp.]MCY4243433.1 DUF5337 domain-containing protein [Rhodobacter sp.]
MTAPTERNRDGHALARQGRRVALVIAGVMLFWMGAQWLGRELDIRPGYAFLFDILALAAFAWAILMAFRIWRKRGGGRE